jgi:hypothetical protein
MYLTRKEAGNFTKQSISVDADAAPDPPVLCDPKTTIPLI